MHLCERELPGADYLVGIIYNIWTANICFVQKEGNKKEIKQTVKMENDSEISAAMV